MKPPFGVLYFVCFDLFFVPLIPLPQGAFWALLPGRRLCAFAEAALFK
jgi:hypothetical protein